MFRLPDRIHKRPFVVGVLVLAFVITIGIAGILFLRMFGASNDMPIIHVTDTRTEVPVTDVGLNIDFLAGANLIKNPSFENTRTDALYTVAASEPGAVYVLPDRSDDGFGDGIFTKGSIRVLSVDETGTLVSRLNGEVTDFSMKQLGMWKDIPWPAEASDRVAVTSIASSASTVIGAGTDGLLLGDISSAKPSVLNSGIREDFVSMIYTGKSFCAVTPSGKFDVSADGTQWTPYTSDTDPAGSIRALSYIGDLYVAAGDYGQVLLCSAGKISEASSGTKSNLLCATGDGNVLLLAGGNAAVKATANGILYRDLTSEELPAFDGVFDWICADYRDGRFLLAGNSGEIAVGTYDSKTDSFKFQTFTATGENGKPIELQKACLMVSGEVLLLGRDGSLYCSDVSYTLWKKLVTPLSGSLDGIGLSSQGKIILTQDDLIRQTELYTEISVPGNTTENQVHEGDMCVLSVSTPSVTAKTQDSVWQLGGDRSDLSVQSDAASGGGAYSVRISGDGNAKSTDAHYISQKLSDKGQAFFSGPSFYQLKLWLKQDGVADGQVMAWISGGFSSIGTTFTDVGSGWRLYTYTFMIPEEAAKSASQETRLNIGFYGTGEIFIDKVFFGIADKSESSIDPEIYTAVTAAKPGLIRMQNVGIGRKGVPEDAWMQLAGNENSGISAEKTDTGIASLETTLTLVRDAKADPWIVIGPLADEETIQKLMGYLCGSLTDPNGMLRAENGTGVPWSMQFDRLVFEINDEDAVFRTDFERSAYVNYVISLIRESSYFLDIQDKVMFLDGMEYSNKSMLSGADGHTWNIGVSNLLPDQGTVCTYSQAVTDGYSDYYDMIPRIPASSQRAVGIGDEWAGSLHVDVFSETKNAKDTSMLPDTVSAAEYVYAFLYDFGKHTSCLMPDLSATAPLIDTGNPMMIGTSELLSPSLILNKNQTTLLRVIGFLDVATDGFRTDVSIDTSRMSGEATEGLSAFVYSDDTKAHLIAGNTSALPITFYLDAPWPLDGASCVKYEADGGALETFRLASRNNKVTLLPGQVVVAEIAVT